MSKKERDKLGLWQRMIGLSERIAIAEKQRANVPFLNTAIHYCPYSAKIPIKMIIMLYILNVCTIPAAYQGRRR